MNFVRSRLFQRAGVQLLWNVLERRNIVVSQVHVQQLAAVIVCHLLEQRLPQTKDSRPFELQLAQTRIDDPARENVGNKRTNPDVPVFPFYYNPQTDRSLFPDNGPMAFPASRLKAPAALDDSPPKMCAWQ